MFTTTSPSKEQCDRLVKINLRNICKNVFKNVLVFTCLFTADVGKNVDLFWLKKKCGREVPKEVSLYMQSCTIIYFQLVV